MEPTVHYKPASPIPGNLQGWNFCPVCGSKISVMVPEGDDHPRVVCRHCAQIYYENPKVIVGTLPRVGDKILLCRRAIEPRYGYWTLPAGFMETNETTDQGAARETWEEARARVKIRGLHSVFSLPHVHQVYMIYDSEVLSGEFSPGAESLECALFHESEIPWGEIAFKAIEFALKMASVPVPPGGHSGTFYKKKNEVWTSNT